MRHARPVVLAGGRGTALKATTAAIIVLVLLLAGCAPAEDVATPDAEAPDEAPEAEMTEEAEPAEEEAPDPAREMVIKEGEARYEVRDVDAAVEEVSDAAETHQAQVMDSSRREHEGRKSAEFQFRLESEHFEAFMEDLEEIEGAVSIETSAEDVTEEVLDLEARLEVLRAQEDRLTDLLEEADDVEEMLMIEEELGRVRSDIESKQGRRDYLEDRVQYSRVQVHVLQREEAVVGEGPGWGDLPQALADGWETWSTRGASMALALVRAWPPLLVLGALAALGIRHRRRRRGEQNASGAPKE